MLNVSGIKGNQTMKFGHLKNIPREIFFLKNYAEVKARKLVPGSFLFFILGKSKWSVAWFHYILTALKLAHNRNKPFKTLCYSSRDMFNFDFVDTSLAIVSPAHFVYDFLTKIFLVLYSISWPNCIAWFPLLLETLGNKCIAIVC